MKTKEATLRMLGTVRDNGSVEIPREWVGHRTMKLPTRAVLAWLLSRVNGEQISVDTLVDENEGWLTRYQAYRALEELEQLGIMHRTGEAWSLVYPGSEMLHPLNNQQTGA